MKNNKLIYIFLLMMTVSVLAGCSTSAINKPVKFVSPENHRAVERFKYNPEDVIKDYNPKNRYAITIWNDGETTRTTYEISDKNTIGNPKAVSDEGIFELMGKNLIYAEFDDDWSIKETIEPIFNEDGVLMKTVKVNYD